MEGKLKIGMKNNTEWKDTRKKEKWMNDKCASVVDLEEVDQTRMYDKVK